MEEKLPSSKPEANISVPLRPLCTICNHSYSIYVCPRCQTRTCSLPCSTAHKARSECTGIRDKVAYVPMNHYGWGTMMDDFVFLEDVGRKVGEWGNDIAKKGFRAGAERGGGRARGTRGRGSGRGNGRGGQGGGGRTKRDVLKMQLELRDIDLDLLPLGMERRKLNQSTWDFKNDTALLTVEFNFHPPPFPSAPSSQLPRPPFTLLTHRNNIEMPLLSLLRAHITERTPAKKDIPKPEWVKDLIFPDPDDPDAFSPPHCLMSAQLDRTSGNVYGSRSESSFYKLDPTQSLAVLLHNTHFVEYPTIEVWEDGAFHGTIVDTQGMVMQYAEEGRVSKRRKLDTKAGRKAINGLLGEYGSDEEMEETTKDGLSMLGAYAGSDDDEKVEHDFIGEAEIDANGETDEEGEIDPAVLIEFIRQAQGIPETEFGTDPDQNEDFVDWGESDGEDAEQ